MKASRNGVPEMAETLVSAAGGASLTHCTACGGVEQQRFSLFRNGVPEMAETLVSAACGASQATYAHAYQEHVNSFISRLCLAIWPPRLEEGVVHLIPLLGVLGLEFLARLHAVGADLKLVTLLTPRRAFGAMNNIEWSANLTCWG